jgi:type I restriction-modification system DNA methylase subunit
MRQRIRVENPDERQLLLPLYPLVNKNFLSSHWLEHRLSLEPEWKEYQSPAQEVLKRLLLLWRVEKDRTARYGDEAGLEEKLIQPVFEILGWKLKYQAYLDGREPDYALFLDDAALDAALAAGRLNQSFWAPAAVVADAKAWHVSLDRPTRVGGRKEYAPEQIEWYLNRSLCDYGILTNGRIWRLVPRVLGSGKPRFQTYLEVDLPRLLSEQTPQIDQLPLDARGRLLDVFQRFFLFFGPPAFVEYAGRKPLIVRAVEGSSEYSVGVGDELKERVFEALRLCVEGFIEYKSNNLHVDTDLRACEENSLIFLYRLLFILYAEDRGLLPYRINPTYTRNRSLARHRDDVATKLNLLASGLDRTDFSRTETAIWNDLKDLFDLIDHGHTRYGVPRYNGGLFNLDSNSFLDAKALPDWSLARVLDQLGRAPQPGRPELGLFRVDYRDLAIQQLGSVYEGLLELQPRYANDAMRVIRNTRGGVRIEKVIAATEPVPRGFRATGTEYPAGGIYLATEKGERRKSGSYYTPDHIVNQIVEQALGGVCREISDTISQEIAEARAALATAPAAERLDWKAQLKALEGSFVDRVLSLKVLDPAMGSGHFLIRACQYLAEEIATNPFTSDPGADALLSGNEPIITYWKRRVAESCLYGVDSNPMAVELAKLALWLETVASDAPLTFLDHHLRQGDSIIGARLARLGSVPGEEGVFQGQFADEVEHALPSLLLPLDEIRALPSATAPDVKQKEQIFQRRFLPAQDRFEKTANLWCAEVLESGIINAEQYAEAVRAVGKRRQFEALMCSEWYEKALRSLEDKGAKPFHWEFAYPDVFLSPHERRNFGFNVIIGNPPYDVLAEREAGREIVHLKRHIMCDPSLQPSVVGKNNLYKLFICRAVELLAEGGYLGFIVPMPILGDEQAVGVRRLLFSSGRFSEIHSFPQKDDASRRVFRDAKLSTAVFTFRKRRAQENNDNTKLRLQVHPAQFIEERSPSLILDQTSVKQYDACNLTIVSCSQTDWDLATRIVNSPGIGRLGSFCKSYQGEVNETTAGERDGVLYSGPEPGRRLVLRGSNVCLYVLRKASQGEDIYIDPSAFFADRRPGSKAFHTRYARVGFQRSSPQNNYRRLIAAYLPAGEFCFDTISYIPEVIPVQLAHVH